MRSPSAVKFNHNTEPLAQENVSYRIADFA